MMRLFLHVRTQSVLIEDLEGAIFVTFDEAWHEAIASARFVLGEQIKAGEVVQGQQIEIADEGGQTVATVPFRTILKLYED
jgi:hypothetical protein